jgi:hypothetical protein
MSNETDEEVIINNLFISIGSSPERLVINRDMIDILLSINLQNISQK